MKSGNVFQAKNVAYAKAPDPVMKGGEIRARRLTWERHIKDLERLPEPFAYAALLTWNILECCNGNAVPGLESGSTLRATGKH